MSRELRVVDAARVMGVGYRQAKRLWKRYGEEGAAGLKHRSAGRRSNRAHPEKFQRKVLGLVREKYGGPVGERFGPTLAVEHLASEDGLRGPGTRGLPRCCHSFLLRPRRCRCMECLLNCRHR